MTTAGTLLLCHQATDVTILQNSNVPAVIYKKILFFRFEHHCQSVFKESTIHIFAIKVK